MKTCSVVGCNNKVWGKGLCQKHIPRTQLKKSPKKYYPIVRQPKNIEKDTLYLGQESYKWFRENFGYSKDERDEFFMEIWKERPHVCEHCGKSLGYEPRTYMFDHILEKSSHPDLFLSKENIWLVCLECHDNKSRGILTDKYKEKINFVKTKFDRS